MDAWSLDAIQGGWLAGIISAGYMVGVIPLVAVTDRMPARAVFLGCAVLSASSYFSDASLVTLSWVLEAVAQAKVCRGRLRAIAVVVRDVSDRASSSRKAICGKQTIGWQPEECSGTNEGAAIGTGIA